MEKTLKIANSKKPARRIVKICSQFFSSRFELKKHLKLKIEKNKYDKILVDDNFNISVLMMTIVFNHSKNQRMDCKNNIKYLRCTPLGELWCFYSALGG